MYHSIRTPSPPASRDDSLSLKNNNQSSQHPFPLHFRLPRGRVPEHRRLRILHRFPFPLPSASLHPRLPPFLPSHLARVLRTYLPQSLSVSTGGNTHTHTRQSPLSLPEVGSGAAWCGLLLVLGFGSGAQQQVWE
jgi:hypothetical protein